MSTVITEHPNVTTVRGFYDALKAGDLEALKSLLSPDATILIPGTARSPACTSGRDAVFGFLGSMKAATDGNYRATAARALLERHAGDRDPPRHGHARRDDPRRGSRTRLRRGEDVVQGDGRRLPGTNPDLDAFAAPLRTGVAGRRIERARARLHARPPDSRKAARANVADFHARIDSLGGAGSAPRGTAGTWPEHTAIATTRRSKLRANW